MPITLPDTVITQIMDCLDRHSQETQRIYALLNAAVSEAKPETFKSPTNVVTLCHLPHHGYTLEAAILTILSPGSQPMTIRDIEYGLDAMGVTWQPNNLRTRLAGLVKTHDIQRPGHGVYAGRDAELPPQRAAQR